MMKFISYLRVSTKRQGLSGLGLDAQREAIARYIASVGGTLVAEFVEVESGKRSDNRPMLARALAACRLHGGGLIVGKLDRLSRSVSFVSNFLESGCEFTACDFPAANKFMLHLLAAVGEYEAKLISERTKVALEAAKRRGTKLGGYRIPSKGRKSIEEIQRDGSRAGNAVRSAEARQRVADLLPIIAELQCDGVASLREIAAGLNQRGITTARGGQWSAVQVSRVIGTQGVSA